MPLPHRPQLVAGHIRSTRHDRSRVSGQRWRWRRRRRRSRWRRRRRGRRWGWRRRAAYGVNAMSGAGRRTERCDAHPSLHACRRLPANDAHCVVMLRHHVGSVLHRRGTCFLRARKEVERGRAILPEASKRAWRIGAWAPWRRRRRRRPGRRWRADGAEAAGLASVDAAVTGLSAKGVTPTARRCLCAARIHARGTWRRRPAWHGARDGTDQAIEKIDRWWRRRRLAWRRRRRRWQRWCSGRWAVGRRWERGRRDEAAHDQIDQAGGRRAWR